MNINIYTQTSIFEKDVLNLVFKIVTKICIMWDVDTVYHKYRVYICYKLILVWPYTVQQMCFRHAAQSSVSRTRFRIVFIAKQVYTYMEFVLVFLVHNKHTRRK